ncbi:hypothetical protein [Devosia sp. CAU 1758]
MNMTYAIGIALSAITLVLVFYAVRARKSEAKATNLHDFGPLLFHGIHKIRVTDRQLPYSFSFLNIEQKFPIQKTESTPNSESNYKVGTKFEYSDSLLNHNNNKYFAETSEIGRKTARP